MKIKMAKISKIFLIFLSLGMLFLLARHTSPSQEPWKLEKDLVQLASSTEEIVGENKENVDLEELKLETEKEGKNSEESPQKKDFILLDVPFLAQSPLGEWDDQRQQDGCEEASSLIAMLWVQGEKEITKDEARKKILEIAQYELIKYQSYRDTSASSTLERIIKGYFHYDEAEVKYDIAAADIIAELEKGNLVIVPANGQALGNPHFTGEGPDRHMLVVIGYDFKTQEFITQDPGTRQGKHYRYDEKVLFNAIRDYPTGDHLPITEKRKAMIVVSKS